MSVGRAWWDQPRARNRKAPFVAFVVLAFVGFGIALYTSIRWSEPAPAPTASTTSATPMVPDDPATLQPIVLMDSTPAGDAIFSTRLTEFAVALDQSVRRGTPAQGDDVARAEAALLAPDVRQALGARAAPALADVVAAAKAAAQAVSQDEATATALEVAVARLDNALITERAPYFLDSMLGIEPASGRRMALLYGFAVATTDLYASADARVRTVRVRRLDHMNWSHTLLGFVRGYKPQAVVLLDQIDEWLVNFVLPALAEGAPMPMLAPDDGDPPAHAVAIAAEGGKGVRADAAELPGLEADAARELGDALRARRALFVKWNDRAKARGLKIEFPRAFSVDMVGLERDLKGAVPRGEIEELRALEKRLARGEVKRAYETLREAFTASIERHEVQHRLDILNPRPKPRVIDQLVPPKQMPVVELKRDRIHSELSAYLSQLARDDRLPHVTFTLLVRFIVDPRLRGDVESYSAIAAVEELSRELGMTDAGPVFHDYKIDDARTALAYQQIVAMRGPELCAAARRLWARLFGAELAPLTGPLPK